jgi:aminoglycoside 6'-N-acetyltransferase
VPELIGAQGALLPDLPDPKPTNLLTERLLLREFRQEDFAELRKIHTDEQMLRFPGDRQVFQAPTRDMLKRLKGEDQQSLPKRSEVAFAMVLRREGVLVGELGFTRLPDAPGSALLWSSMNSNYHGQSVMTEAIQSFLPFAHAQCGLSRLLAHCRTENLVVQRVLAKIGFQLLRNQKGSDELEFTIRLPADKIILYKSWKD